MANVGLEAEGAGAVLVKHAGVTAGLLGGADLSPMKNQQIR